MNHYVPIVEYEEFPYRYEDIESIIAEVVFEEMPEDNDALEMDIREALVKRYAWWLEEAIHDKDESEWDRCLRTVREEVMNEFEERKLQ